MAREIKHISNYLPSVLCEIRIKQAEYILANENDYSHDEVAEAQTLLHSKPVVREIDEPPF